MNILFPVCLAMYDVSCFVLFFCICFMSGMGGWVGGCCGGCSFFLFFSSSPIWVFVVNIVFILLKNIIKKLD